MASAVLTPNFISCLKNHLASTERTLHADAERICQALQSRAAKDPDFAVVAVTSLLGPAGKVNFDKATRTKTVEKIIANASNATLQPITQFLTRTFIDRTTTNSNEVERNRQSIVDWLTFIFTRQESKRSSETIESWKLEILLFMIRHAYFIPNQASAEDRKPEPPLTESTRAYLHQRLSNCLEQYLRHTDTAFARLCDVMDVFWSWLQDPQSGLDAVLDLDPTISNTANASWANLRSLSISRDDLNPVVTALGLLLCITLLQFYGGDGDAVSILEDLNEEISRNEDRRGKRAGDRPLADTDSIVEIVLTLTSKPSKLLRRVGLLVFELIAPQITHLGLDSLLQVLCTKESLQGQGELFDTGEDLQESASLSTESDTSSASDVDVLDQDRDQPSTTSSPSLSVYSSSGEEANPQRLDQDEDVSSDPELAAFDAKLAAALKTHRGDEDLNASSASSENMSDSEMEAIDAQLAAVFAARKEASKSKQSKQEHRFARENIVNFKNRVLDLMEIFFKSQKDNPLTLASLGTVLSAARFTNSKQVAERIYQVLRAFNDRCKGKSHLPPCPDPAATLSDLRAIHEVAQQDASHAHSTACGNAAVLLVRVISHKHHQPEIIEQIVSLYAESTKAFLLNGSMMPGFFIAWNNWYVQMKGPPTDSKKTVNMAEKHNGDGEAAVGAKQGSKGRQKSQDTEHEKTVPAVAGRRKGKKRKRR